MADLDYRSCYAALACLLEADGVKSFFLQPDFSNASLSDNGIKADLFLDYDYATLKKAYMYGASKEGEICIFMDELHMNNILVHFPSSFGLDGDVAVFGPFIFDCDVAEVVGRCMRLAGDQMAPVVKQNLESVPRMGENYSRRYFFSNTCIRLFNHPFKVCWYPYDAGIRLNDESFNHRMKSLNEVSLENIEERYRMENRFISAIQKGDAEGALAAYDVFLTLGSVQKRVPDMIRNRQNYLIILNTLARKAAEKSGVHPLYVDSYSSRFAMEISRADTIGHLVNLSRCMIREYSDLVRDKALSSCSKSVRQIVVYTDFHYSENLSLSFFSERFHVSKNHLSALFHKQMGMTITEYVRKVRIDAACILLRSSSIGLAEIASQCGFEGPNYFIRQFKAEMGMTPKQYRCKHSKEGYD